MYVAVIGPGGEEDPLVLRDAEAVGRGVAERGGVVVCGGLGGVMAAACRGARAAGGLTVGLLPGDDRGAAGPDVAVALPTGLGEARDALVVRAADAVIALGGGWGTLAEIGLALRMGRPVIGLGTWELALGGRAPEAGVVLAADAAGAVALAWAGVAES